MLDTLRSEKGSAVPLAVADVQPGAVLFEARTSVLKFASKLLVWIGAPAQAVVTIVGGANGDPMVLGWVQFAILLAAGVAIPRLPTRGVVSGGGLLMLLFGMFGAVGFYRFGPVFGIGCEYMAWLLGAAFFFDTLWPALVGAMLLLGSAYAGVEQGLIHMPWNAAILEGNPLFRVLSTVSLVSIAVGVMFRSLIRSLVEAVARETQSRVELAKQQQEREQILIALAESRRVETLGRLAGGVAHDVNNALAVLSLGVEEMREFVQGDDLTQTVDDMTRAVRGARDTTARLLEFVRRGRQGSAGSYCRPQHVAQQLANSLVRVFPSNIHIQVEGHLDATVALSPGDCEQLLLNLCLNARDAMPQGGTIVIRLSVEDTEARPLVCMEVVDDGEGMSATVLAKATEAFFTTKPQGTGLGLDMARNTISAIGGSIDLSSREGHGTRVRILLPIVEDAVEATEPEARTAGAGRHILVVEDEDALRRLTVRALRRAGYRVTEASCVADGLEAALAEWPDVLLTDAMLPDGSPAPMITRMRAERPETPVLIVSGFVASTDTAGLIESKAVRFLQKPVSTETLLAAVESLLAAAPSIVRSPPPQPAR